MMIGIETDRGLWVGALTAAGYQVFAINPLAAARYRDRHHVSGAKSDASDAKLLADLVRTDRHNHRAIAGDSADAEAIKVLARAHQSLIWSRTRHTNALRNALREYYPAALVAFEDLTHGDALGVLDRAPTPAQGAHLPLTALQAALKRGGRQRNIAARAREIRAALRTEQLTAPARSPRRSQPPPAPRWASSPSSTARSASSKPLLAEHFETHPDADIYRSLPGLGVVLGARVLGEFGDDPNRYTDAKSRRNYAGTSPLTVASGKKRAVLARHVRNRRLYDAIDQWAFCALTNQPRRASASTTSTAPPTTPTTKPSAPWATASSASCTAAYATTPPTTNAPHGPTAWPRLDNLRTWDV